ncbi:hypothetical protein LOS73_19070 [Pseudoalteromonas sp. SCSIO 43210]
MKLTIKQFRADIQAPQSALRASDITLDDVQSQFSEWIMQGLSQMDWPELDESDLQLDTIKLPDLVIDLAEIDWQFVMLDPFAAFKHYVYPLLSDSIARPLKQYRKQNSAQFAVINSQGATRLNRVLLSLLTKLSKQNPQGIMAKTTLRLELKRQISEAIKTISNPLQQLQAEPNWPQLRQRFVQLFKQDKTVLLLLVAPLYNAQEQQRVSKLLACLSMAQCDRFIRLLEFTTSITEHTEREQQCILLLSLHELFVAHSAFSERLLLQTTAVLNTPKYRQMLSMWCVLNKAQCNKKLLSDLQRIVTSAAKQSDLAIELVEHTELVNNDSRKLNIAKKVNALGVKQQQTLKQVLTLLQILADSHALPKQRLKAWFALQVIRANQTRLSVTLASKLTQITQAVGDTFRKRETPEHTVDKIVKLTDKLGSEGLFSCHVNNQKLGVLRLYSLLSRLPDVPALLLERPIKWQVKKRIPEQEIQCWFDDVNRWSKQYQQIATKKQLDEFAIQVNHNELSTVLKQIKIWLVQYQQTMSLDAYDHIVLPCVIELLKSLPIQKNSNLWLQLHSTESGHAFNRIVEKLQVECQRALSDESTTQANLTGLLFDGAQSEKAMHECLDKLYQKLNRNLVNMVQSFEQQHALTSGQTAMNNRGSITWQCYARVTHMAKFGYKLQFCYQPSLQRVYRFVLNQQVWLANELSSLLFGEIKQDEQCKQLQKIITQHVQSLGLIEKELLQKLPLIARAEVGLDAWFTPLISHATKHLTEMNSVWLQPFNIEELYTSRIANFNDEQVTVFQPQKNERRADSVTHNITQEYEVDEKPLAVQCNLQKHKVDTHITHGAVSTLVEDEQVSFTKATLNATKDDDKLRNNFLPDVLTHEDNNDSVLLNMSSDMNISHKPSETFEYSDEHQVNVDKTQVTLDKNSAQVPKLNMQKIAFENNNTRQSKGGIKQTQSSHVELDIETIKDDEVHHGSALSAQNNKLNKVSSYPEETIGTHSSILVKHDAKEALIAQTLVTLPQGEKNQVVTPSETLLNALMAVERVDETQNLLAHIEKRADVQSTLQNSDLKQAIKQSKRLLTKLARTTSSEGEKGVVQSAISQVKTQLAQLQQMNEQQNEPVTFDVGLVILWPFLPTLFTRLELMDEGEFKNDDTQMQAHAVLCYIANIDPLIEVSLTVNALLGLPLDTQIEEPIELNEQTIMAIDHMLHALVNRWEVLKRMPTIEFSKMFITREGTVEQTESGCHIRVVTMPQDVLMSKLPWGLGMVTLPWLGQALLHIEWKYGF